MSENLSLLLSGFGNALRLENLVFAFAGCFLGTLVGMLPGLGPSAAIAILLPITAAMDPTAAIVMLAAIYYGCQYGDTITAVLFNTPGTGGAAMTAVEGHMMAKQGRAGTALAIAAIASFVGGTVTVGLLAMIALPLTSLALNFGPPEFFALIVLSLVLVVTLGSSSILRGLITTVFGLILAMVGTDPVMGLPRLTFGQMHLLDGVAFIPVIIGLFGVGEILKNLEDPTNSFREAVVSKLRITRDDARRSAPAIARGTVLGFLIGIIPGMGTIPAAFMSYVTEKRLSRTPERFGTGMIEGVAGPESANNAAANGALLPLLTLGIPGSGVVAILMGALMMNGIVPGPLMFEEQSDLVWTLIASMYVGNVILLVLNLPFIPMWVSILRIPYSFLFPVILGFTIVGAYSLANSQFDLGLIAVFGLIGYIMRKLDFPLVPIIMTLILGPMMEGGLRRSLEMSQGDFTIFLQRPITAGFLTLAVVFLLLPLMSGVRRRLKRASTPVSPGETD
ncbi:tripartite tricarboxylate transporter permease [Stappia stellulata]|uniref:tripartite tricarboxylate transporter permease n=1 Tax=Stappia stellulata TaxID=71235 RepID=UPI001CD7648D|nr:tripartite tricarboxylate transporter permease [Stappia stellulata]MCA1242126.1 tripartite tricarboxylate transporter permease [Stappia stellulata]